LKKIEVAATWENVSSEDVYYSPLNSIDELKPGMAKTMAVEWGRQGGDDDNDEDRNKK
jgi:hypothetical protein